METPSGLFHHLCAIDPHTHGSGDPCRIVSWSQTAPIPVCKSHNRVPAISPGVSPMPLKRQVAANGR